MRQFVPLEFSSFRLRAGWHTMLDAFLQLIRLVLVAVFLVMLAWSAVGQMRAHELPARNAVQANAETKMAFVAPRGDHAPHA